MHPKRFMNNNWEKNLYRWLFSVLHMIHTLFVQQDCLLTLPFSKHGLSVSDFP